MGILRSLITLPISGPVTGAFWVARQVHEAADRERNDPVAIRRALRALEVELESGRIDDATFEEAEQILLRRLQGAAR